MTDTFNAIDYLVWALFTVEYLVKLYLAPDRRRFVTSHLLDLLVIAVPVLRPLRILRFVRVLRTVRVVTVLGGGLRRGRSVLTHHGLHFVLLTVFLVILAAAALETIFESGAKGGNIHGYGDALWWAIVTVTTVGYGDAFPVTPAGRGVAVVLMLVGIGLVGVVTATVASYFIETGSSAPDDRLAQVEDRLAGVEQTLDQILAAITERR